MPVLIIAAIIAAVASVAAAGIKAAVDAGEHDKAQKLANEAALKYSDLVVPKLRELGFHEQADTLMKSVGKEGRAAQMKALEQLGNVSEGKDAQTNEAYREARDRAGQQGAVNRLQAESQAAQRGMAGTQSEYLSALLGGQSAANTYSDMASKAAADQNARRMQALQMLGDVGGQLRSGDQREAAAQDEINRFNAQMAMDRDRYNANLGQQDFNNRRNLAGDQANAMLGLAARQDANAERTGANITAAGASVQQGAQGIGGAINADQQYEAWKKRQQEEAASNGAGASGDW